MYTTYPKKSANPSASVGEQENRSGWDGSNGSKTSYPTEGGASSTSYQGAKSHTKLVKGSDASKPGNDYPGKKFESFATEKMDKR
jgi:hypothetical protein